MKTVLAMGGNHSVVSSRVCLQNSEKREESLLPPKLAEVSLTSPRLNLVHSTHIKLGCYRLWLLGLLVLHWG